MAKAKGKTKQTKQEKETVKNGQKSKLLSTQRYLAFAGVHDDTLVLQNGGIRAVLNVSSLNLNLKSEEEQNAILYSYQSFLNALEFPVQILVQSRKLDIDTYLNGLKRRRNEQQNKLLQAQMEEYIEYIAKLVEYADIMEKRFYVVIPVNPQRSEKKSLIKQFKGKISPDETLTDIIQRKQEFAELKKTLDERVNIVQTGLENCGLKTRKLSTEEIIQLFYQTYNPELARMQRMEQMEDIMGGDIPEEKLQTEDKPEES